MNVYDALIRHELGHAFCAQAVGLKVRRVFTPPPDMAAAAAHPESAAGYTEFARTRDRQAKAVVLLGGPLGEGRPPPRWPLTAGTSFEHDRNELAKLFCDAHELDTSKL
jgi:hypothetical protein